MDLPSLKKRAVRLLDSFTKIVRTSNISSWLICSLETP